MGVIALIYLLACGSLLFWIGFRIDPGKDIPLELVLHLPPALRLAYERAVLSTSLFFSSATKTFNPKGMVENGVLTLFLLCQT